MTGVNGLPVPLDGRVAAGVSVQNSFRIQLFDDLQRIIHLGRGGGVWEHGAGVDGGGAGVVSEHGPGDPGVEEGLHVVRVQRRSQRLVHIPDSCAMGNYWKCSSYVQYCLTK
jgi:hypothetical protein